MKRILLIAYFFPPYSQVGAFRITKLAKYFFRMGWEVSVITINDEYYNDYDKNYKMLSDIKGINIIRTNKSNFRLPVKEQGLYWVKSMYKAVVKEMKKKKYHYVFYTAGPFLQLSVAPLIKKVTKVPYIIDYRDPWRFQSYSKSRKFKFLAKIIEPYVIAQADYLLNVTEPVTRIYKNYYNKTNCKFLTVENGYDEEDFKNIESKRLVENGFSIVYSGKFGGFRNVIPFLDSLNRFNKISDKKFYFIHVGQKEQIIQEYLNKNIEMKKYIIQIGFVSYNNALEYIKGADVCLIIGGGKEYEPTTKVYDYMALNKLILCINNIQYGYLYETLKKYNFSKYVNNDENDILKVMHEIKNQNSNNVKIDSRQYSREVIFKKLSDELIKNNKVIYE